MPKANEVATELRKLADSLDREPEAIVPNANIYFSASYIPHAKETFKNICRLLPRPLTKRTETYGSDPDLIVEHKREAVQIHARIRKSECCTLITPARPAVYSCDPILSPEEENALTEETNA